MVAASNDRLFLTWPGGHWFGASWEKKWYANRVGCTHFYAELRLCPSACIYFTRHVTPYISFSKFLTKLDSSSYPSARALSSCCVSFLAGSQRCTSTRVGERDLGSWWNPSSRPQAGVTAIKLTSWDLSYFHENLLFRKPTLTLGEKRNSKGGRSSFNLCWGINWAFRWAWRPWIWKDEKEEIKEASGNVLICQDVVRIQGRRRKVSNVLLLFFWASLIFLSRKVLLHNTRWLPPMQL